MFKLFIFLFFMCLSVSARAADPVPTIPQILQTFESDENKITYPILLQKGELSYEVNNKHKEVNIDFYDKITKLKDDPKNYYDFICAIVNTSATRSAFIKISLSKNVPLTLNNGYGSFKSALSSGGSIENDDRIPRELKPLTSEVLEGTKVWICWGYWRAKPTWSCIGRDATVLTIKLDPSSGDKESSVKYNCRARPVFTSTP